MDTAVILNYLDNDIIIQRLRQIDNDRMSSRTIRRAINLIDDINELDFSDDMYFKYEVYKEINYYYQLLYGKELDEDASTAFIFFDEYIDNKGLGSLNQLQYFSQDTIAMEEAIARTIWDRECDEEILGYLKDGNSVPENLIFDDLTPTTFYYIDRNGEEKSVEITVDLCDRYYEEYQRQLEIAKKAYEDYLEEMRLWKEAHQESEEER